MRQRSPIDPNWAPLLIKRKRNNTTNTIFIELPLELGCVICTGIIDTCNCFEVICESRGPSNLTPSRSRLFKLIGRVKRYEVELQQATSIFGG